MTNRTKLDVSGYPVIVQRAIQDRFAEVRIINDLEKRLANLTAKHKLAMQRLAEFDTLLRLSAPEFMRQVDRQRQKRDA